MLASSALIENNDAASRAFLKTKKKSICWISVYILELKDLYQVQ